MAYQVGGKRDKHLRAGLIVSGLAGSLWLLTTPDPPPGQQQYPAAPDGYAQRVVAERHVALRAQFEVIGSAPWLLTDPQQLLVPGTQELPDETRFQKRRQPGEVAQPGAQQNLLYAVAPAQDPFVSVDFPNPQRPKARAPDQPLAPSQSLLTSPSELLTPGTQELPDTTRGGVRKQPDVLQPGAQQNLLYTVTAPFVPVDYPNPTLRKWTPTNRTWLQRGQLYIGQDVLYGAPGQVPAYDWPNPRVPRRSVELRGWAQTGYLLVLNPPPAVDPSVPSTAADYLRAMQSVLQASGYFSRVTIGEPDA